MIENEICPKVAVSAFIFAFSNCRFSKFVFVVGVAFDLKLSEKINAGNN